MNYKYLLSLTVAASISMSAFGIPSGTRMKPITESYESSSAETFLLNEGSRVFIVQDNSSDYLLAAQTVIIRHVKERGFWNIVDKIEYADFVLHYVSSTNGRMQVGLFIETPDFYQREKNNISFTKAYQDAYKVSSRYADESVSNNEKLASEFYQRLNTITSGIVEGRINPDLKKRFTVTGPRKVVAQSNDVSPLPNQIADTPQMPQMAQVVETTITQFSNPIFGNEYPNPAILREGNIYYMTHSSFKNQTGLTVYLSNDLIHWKPISYIVQPNLGRAWTPDICRVGNLYYIYFTVQNSYPTNMTTNYVVYSNSPYGPWSEPINLKVQGVDPSHVVDVNKQRWLIMNGGNQIKLSPDGLSVIQQYRVNDAKSNQNPETLENGRIKFSQFYPR